MSDPAQQLRLRIGRNRRRIERRLRAAREQTRRLRSWTAWAKWRPGPMVQAAFGVGLALSAGLGARRWGRWLGLRLARNAWTQLRGSLLTELQHFWRRADEAEHDAGGPP